MTSIEIPDEAMQASQEALQQMGVPPGRYRLESHSKMARAVAARLTGAARDIPHFSLTRHIAMQAVLDARAGMTDDPRPSVNDFAVAAAAQALVDVPAVNVSFTDSHMVHHDHADVAFAVAFDGGLVTPIICEAERKSVAEIAVEARELADRGRRRRLRPDEYTGGTFCISNLGMMGISNFGSIINPPHAAILSLGAIEDRVVVLDGLAALQKMMTATLTCDHRAIDGATGARWLSAFASRLSAITAPSNKA